MLDSLWNGIEFSCVSLIQELFLYLTLRIKFITLELDSIPKTVQHRTLLPLTLLLSSTKGQHCPLVKKLQLDPRLKRYTS